MPVIPTFCPGNVLRIVLEVQIMEDGERGYPGIQGEIAIGGNEDIGLVLPQQPWYNMLEPGVVQDRVAGLRTGDDSLDVGRSDECRVVRPVEKVEELVFRMVPGHPAKGLEGEPTDAFELTGQEQAGVDGDPHVFR